MKLLPLDSPGLLELAAVWLAQEENYRWLDFGGGRQIVTPALLRVMTQRETHCLRIYTAGPGDDPVGIVGLNDVNRHAGTATLWGVTGDKSFRSRGYATFAGSRFLTHAFGELGLRVVNTWAVEHNPSVRLIERLNFRFVGRLRQCHRMDGQVYDRLLFDLLAGEHRELEYRHPERGRRPRDGMAEAGPVPRPAGAAPH
ncbi:MAG TPA: GNAT family protein [Steroidobacteraceae bacterium]